MSSPPSEPLSSFGTPNFPFQVNSQGTSGESRMPGYNFFRQATCDFSQLIGRGQLGKVYKAHLPTGEVVAVKLLYQMTGFDDKRFSNNCTQLMSTNHKNIVRLLGYSYEEHEESHVHYGTAICGVYIRRLIGFEYVPGGNLSNFISDQRLGWSIRFKIIKGVCEGLQYLHEAGIVHSNLTPGNILLDGEKIPKITDFGLSRMFKPVNKRATMSKTISYGWWGMIREGVVSKRSDIFSLGALIKVILTGSTEESDINCMDGPECVEHVHKYWRKRLQEIRRYPSFEADCKQVRACIEIAVDCMHNDQQQRPLINNIVRKLYEVEAKGDYPPSQMGQGIHGFEVRKMSLKELEQITSNFSEKLGHDDFGAVYKGRIGGGEVIAVKRFDERLRKLEDQFERVVNLMRLKHKNIVRLMGYCYEPTQVPVPDEKNPEKTMWWNIIENLVCYEFLPNGSLDMILNDKSCKLDWQARHKIIHGICEGLHHLHVECQDAPIVHQGIKPTNILLDDGMVPKLGDFYTSMAVTPRCYIAPESMDNGKITLKSNVYSLGVMILEISTRDKCRNEESSSRSYINNVLKSRTQNSYVASKYPSLEAGFIQQVESWIIIGLKCVEIQPESRPTIGQIMHFLNTESSNAGLYIVILFFLDSFTTGGNSDFLLKAPSPYGLLQKWLIMQVNWLSLRAC
ncbi:hypothetical protein CFC21_074864 [Triticum aestivum]|uniref:Protein kinase domain-containing protein n=2 Tax=Triticum aestivum TaxID=4565 RepID=A0A3B6LXW3_WHEAT|nr:hypothetical protein CFC21_074864 [Triticum aestivum]